MWYKQPEIFYTDQGSQFTKEGSIGLLSSNGIQISMDAKGRAFDNIFLERLWRTVKNVDFIYTNYHKLRLIGASDE